MLEPDLKQRTLATPLIDHRQHPKRAAVGKSIVDEVHAPALGRAYRCRRRPAMQRHVLAPPHAHAQLQALEPVEPSHALVVHPPALAAQQHPDAQEAEAWPSVRDLPDPHPQGGLVRRAGSGDTMPPD